MKSLSNLADLEVNNFKKKLKKSSVKIVQLSGGSNMVVLLTVKNLIRELSIQFFSIKYGRLVTFVDKVAKLLYLFVHLN